MSDWEKLEMESLIGRQAAEIERLRKASNTSVTACYQEILHLRDERLKLKTALEEIIKEVGTSTRAAKIARTALGIDEQ